MAQAELSPVEQIFGPLLPDRSCGGCTACRTVPAIAELQKLADTTCAHCVGDGCSIYEERPSACRTFFCGWRRLDSLPEDLRPDRCGVIVMLEVDPEAANPFDRICVVARWQGGEIAPALIDRLLGILGRGFIPLFLSSSGSERKILAHPAPEIYRAIVNGERVAGKDKERVKRWRTMLNRPVAPHD
jgi:hypothetical protein